MKNAIAIVFILSLNIVFKFINHPNLDYFEYSTLTRLILIILTAAYLFSKFKMQKEFFFKNTLIYSVVCILLLSASFYNFIDDYQSKSLTVYFAFSILTGVFEELLFRVLILFVIWELLSFMSVFSKIIINSLVFGLVHLSNLFNENIIEVTVFTQVLFAFVIGIFLIALLFKTKNIIVPISIHALINFYGRISDLNQTVVFTEYTYKNVLSTLLFIGIISVILLPLSQLLLKGEFKKWDQLKFKMN